MTFCATMAHHVTGNMTNTHHGAKTKMKKVEYITSNPHLITCLKKWNAKTYNSKDRYGNPHYHVAFDTAGVKEVRSFLTNLNARFHRVANLITGFYSMEVWNALRGVEKKRTTFGHAEETTKPSTCCGHVLNTFTFKDGQTISLCRLCGVHFTTITEQPLRKHDAHRAFVLRGGAA
jgi:hypothetical protein